MPIKAGPRGDGLDLLFEVISFAGPLRRELVAAIATTIMGYSARGICGVFQGQANSRTRFCSDLDHLDRQRARAAAGEGKWVHLRNLNVDKNAR